MGVFCIQKAIHVLLLAAIVSAAFPLPALAQEISFNPNLVIADADFFRVDDMSVAEIQSFLQRKGSALANYRAADTDEIEKSAAEIIFRAARNARINPKILLVLLQKEQSLIENPAPTQSNYDWATGYSVCDSCSRSDPAVAANRGFVTQVTKAAARKRAYVEHPSDFQFRAGLSKSVDGAVITPANAATAALYNYTPHIRGNYSFWKLWVRYFEKFYPDGTLAQERGSESVWMIQNGIRRRFASLGVFLSRYSPGGIVTVDPGGLDKYFEGPPIKFPQYSLLQSKKGAVFLIADEKKYGIPSRQLFRQIGFNPGEIMRVTDADLDTIEDGGLILSSAVMPRIELWQDAKTGGVYAIEGGAKHPLKDRAILAANFPHQKIARKTAVELDRLPTGDPILFRDGTLVSSSDSPAVYVISNGAKRPFISGEVFEALGYRWTQVVKSNGSALALHPLGDTVDLGKDLPEDVPESLLANAP